MSEKIVQFKNVSFSYLNQEGFENLIKNIDLEIFRGEFITIIGENGCGKSTIARLMTCLIKPTKGQILI